MFGLVSGCVLVGFIPAVLILVWFLVINQTTVFFLINGKGKPFASLKNNTGYWETKDTSG
jgi:hypothetical protein